MKSKSADIPLAKEHVDAFDQLVAQIKEESDRAAVIIGTAKLDYLLYQLLSHYMVASYTKDDALLESDGPLSTLSSRINISYRLGLIDTQFAKALHLVRKIRNDFAHDVKESRLSDAPHRERVRELALVFRNSKLFNDVRKAHFSDMSGGPADFFSALAILIMRLETIILKVEPVVPSEAFGIPLS